MANTFEKKIVRDGIRNAVVNLVGLLDTNIAAPTQVQQILRADFTSNDPNLRALNGFRLDKVWYSISDGALLQLFWDATADRIAVALAGRGKISYCEDAGLQPTTADAGYTGDMNLFAYAPAATTTQVCYTLKVELIKDYTV